jgi:hypothetical protein
MAVIGRRSPCARNSACGRVYNAVMRAPADALPDRIIASGHDTTNAIGLGHRGPDRSAPFELLDYGAVLTKPSPLERLPV